MPQTTTRPFGLWDSPITPSSLAAGLRLDAAVWDSDGDALVWLEGRSGRGVLVAGSSLNAAPRDLTADIEVRAEVGYGGGDFTVSRGDVYFVEKGTGRIHRQSLAGGAATPITPPFGKASSPVVSPDGKWIAYVHHDGHETDSIAIVDTAGRYWPQVLTSGHDFYMQPRFSPDGTSFCWISWNHPNMPWDGTTLSLAGLIKDDGHLPRLDEPQIVAGGDEIAVFQPEFTPDGRSLLYVTDKSGWGRLTIHDLTSGEKTLLTPKDVELALPGWVQDMRTYAVSPDSRSVIAAYSQQGFVQIHRIDLTTGESVLIEELAEYTEVSQLRTSPVDDRIVFSGSSPTQPRRIVEHNFSEGTTRIIARSSGETVKASRLSRCEPLWWETAGGEEAYGLFYPPQSDRFEGAGKPPLIVLIHGGPTSQTRAGFSPDAQFFATRGFAVLHVNYRGSTGYGREYMLRLRSDWGICDVEDAVSGKQFLVDIGRVDPQRTAIMGGSAGGFTVLQTLCEHPKEFTAGISLYGVANQFHLAAETHKFESRYLDSMLGPLPEASKRYHERSPEFHADKIVRPLAVFQGEIDRVVPRAQSDAIVDALKRNGTPHIYHVYEGEGHGWRKRETIEHFYNTVETFLRQHVIFT